MSFIYCLEYHNYFSETVLFTTSMIQKKFNNVYNNAELTLNEIDCFDIIIIFLKKLC